MPKHTILSGSNPGQDPFDQGAQLSDLQREVKERQRHTGGATDWRDDAGRLRIRLGRQEDGTWGLRIWDNAGTLQVNQTWAA